MSLIKIFLTAMVVNLVFVGGLLFAVYDITKTSAVPFNVALPQTKKVFKSEEECLTITGKACQFQMCDYVPDGKTFEEVCGADFKKGWVPIP